MAKRNPESPVGIDLPDYAVSFDEDQFDNAIRSHGVEFQHYRGMRCPVGMVDQFDTRRPHEDHSGCQNGFLYTPAGIITCLFTGNGKNRNMGDTGIMDGSTVQVTLPRAYDDSEKPLYIASFDRLYLKEENITVVHWQLHEHHASGRDKLSFPVCEVQDLVDSQNKVYGPGDFAVEQGQIVWKTQNRPGLDPETGKGRIYSVRYTYRPYFYVRQLMHEVRVSQSEDPITGERVVRRMPQMALLDREHIHESQEKDDQAPDPQNPRQYKGPDDGLFGPR